MHRRTTRSIVAALAITGALMAAGCSSGGNDSDGATPSPTSTTSSAETEEATTEPSPTETEISVADAGAQYLALAAPYNELIGQARPALEAGDYVTFRSLSGELATAGRAFADGLLAAQWPEAAQETVDTLMGEVAAEIPINAQIAVATTDADTVALVYSFPQTTNAGQKLRILLGLPDVPVS